ncbi:MAG TPA: cytochrome c-type biogenesis protein CcmH [Terriglobales bacterium]|nr:cytochrome c-type biogenesis protein CcmH [Terriglobales bacterium]
MRALIQRPVQLAILVLVSLAFMGAGDGAEQRFQDLGHKLMCKCGCNQILLECNHVGCSYSERMRAELMAGVERGDSDSLVLQAFVQKYGPTVLAAPPTSGFNRVAWITPYLALMVGIGLVIVLVRKWKYRVTPVGATNLNAAELEALRQRARQETQL